MTSQAAGAACPARVGGLGVPNDGGHTDSEGSCNRARTAPSPSSDPSRGPSEDSAPRSVPRDQGARPTPEGGEPLSRRAGRRAEAGVQRLPRQEGRVRAGAVPKPLLHCLESGHKGTPRWLNAWFPRDVPSGLPAEALCSGTRVPWIPPAPGLSREPHLFEEPAPTWVCLGSLIPPFVWGACPGEPSPTRPV